MKTRMSVDMRIGETLQVGDTLIQLERKSGQQARLIIMADESVAVITPKAQRDAAAADNAHMRALQPSGAHHG